MQEGRNTSKGSKKLGSGTVPRHTPGSGSNTRAGQGLWGRDTNGETRQKRRQGPAEGLREHKAGQDGRESAPQGSPAPAAGRHDGTGRALPTHPAAEASL